MSVRIADRWFERRAIGDGVTLLWEPHVHPFLRCNIWHVRGRDADMLVDTGLGVASLKDAARDLFDKNLLAVATHTHMDHTGGIHEFETRLVHEAEAGRMTSGAGGWALDTSRWSAADLKHWADIGYDLSGGLLDAHPHTGYDPRTHGLKPAAPTRTLAEGDIVDTGDRAFEVLHLPGHSPGSIGLWEAKTGTLFSGDALYDGPLLDEIEGASIPVYIETMKRLREMPVSIVHAGHDPSFGRDRLIELCDAYLAKRT